ncbi:MAG TPA: hypothetical protein VHJ17_00155 [Thermomonospora sp.]|nr:hypothetical protein [Thermomonospora sp.]
MGEVTIAGREDPDGLTLVTSGLSARGLPELTVTGLPPYLGQAWARLLAVLAHRLAATGPDVPPEVTLVPADLAAIGERPGDWRQVTIALTREGDHLVPSPPPGTETGRWRTELARLLFPAARG